MHCLRQCVTTGKPARRATPADWHRCHDAGPARPPTPSEGQGRHRVSYHLHRRLAACAPSVVAVAPAWLGATCASANAASVMAGPSRLVMPPCHVSRVASGLRRNADQRLNGRLPARPRPGDLRGHTQPARQVSETLARHLGSGIFPACVAKCRASPPPQGFGGIALSQQRKQARAAAVEWAGRTGGWRRPRQPGRVHEEPVAWRRPARRSAGR